MSLPLFCRALAVWTCILLLAVANGAVREALLAPAFGPSTALLASGIALALLVLLVTRASIRWLRPPSARDAWSIGLLWIALTLAFEFALGALVLHKPWPEMLAAYSFRGGNLWPAVLLVVLLAPRVCLRAA